MHNKGDGLFQRRSGRKRCGRQAPGVGRGGTLLARAIQAAPEGSVANALYRWTSRILGRSVLAICRSFFGEGEAEKVVATQYK